MEWEVLLHPDFDAWLLAQESGVRIAITAQVALLKTFGPALGRPQVDTLKGATVANLKELRIQYQGTPWRVLFVFDPKRRAILLVGGTKQGNARWYTRAIPLAEQRYREHLDALRKEHGTNT